MSPPRSNRARYCTDLAWLDLDSTSDDFDHRRAAYRIMLQRIQRRVRFNQVENLRLSLDRNLGRHAQEIQSVLSGVVGHAAEDAFVVEQLVINWRNLAHMNPSERYAAALLQNLQSRNHQFARRREDDRAVEFN